MLLSYMSTNPKFQNNKFMNFFFYMIFNFFYFYLKLKLSFDIRERNLGNENKIKNKMNKVNNSEDINTQVKENVARYIPETLKRNLLWTSVADTPENDT